MSNIDNARLFAQYAHDEQKRKYTGEPYYNHCENVMKNLINFHPEASEEMLIAALLHDVVEDTCINRNDIESVFGKDVRRLVFWLTDISTKEDGNRAKRKELDRKHIEKAPQDAQIIKLADIIDNTESIVKHDKKFAKVYIEEVRAIIDCMRDSVKSTMIYAEAKKQIVIAWFELN